MSIPYPEVLMEPNRTPYLKLCAIVGRGKVSSPEKWGEWDRLVEKFGWPILLRGADRCEPMNRWSTNIESICIQLKANEAESIKEAEARERMATAPKPQNPAQSAKLFSEIRKRIGV